MNDLFINGLFPGSFGIGMSPNVDSQFTSNVGQGTPFVDVLGLVSDMEVVDAQVENQSPFLEENSQKMWQAHRENQLGSAMTGIEALATQSLAGMPTEKVGQAGVPSKDSLETLVGVSKNPESMLAADLSMPLQAPVKEGSPDMKATAMWASALQSGDLKAVEMLPRQDGAEQRLAAGMAQMDIAQEALGVGEKPKAQEKAVSADAKSSRLDMASSQVDSKSGFKRAEFPNFSSEDRGSEQGAEHKAAQKAPLLNKGNRPQNASDFLLGRLSPSSEMKVERFASPFVETKTVGSPGDSRVSSEALNFVGQKVQDLKNAGGGDIRIDLNPKHLGALEIHVGVVHGKMEVTIRAESQDTLQALQGSSEQLKGKLDLIATTDLKVLAKDHRPIADMGAGARETSVSVKSLPIASSQDLMSLRDMKSHVRVVSKTAGSEMAPAFDSKQMNVDLTVDAPVDTRAEARMEPKLESSRGSSSMESDARSEKQSDAWDRWEEYQRRKTA